MAAIVVDLSEDLRDREDLSLDYLLNNTKILMRAVAHEIRNICGAVLAVYKNLSRLSSLKDNEDFRALGTLIEGLEKLSEMELLRSRDHNSAAVELTSLLDEPRVLIEPVYREAGAGIVWRLQDDLPLVTGDRYGSRWSTIWDGLVHSTSDRALSENTFPRLSDSMVWFSDRLLGGGKRYFMDDNFQN